MNTNCERHELKEAIETIASLARKPLQEATEVKTTTLFGRPYYMDRNNCPVPVDPPDFQTPARLEVSSLDGLIDMVRNEGVGIELPSLHAPVSADDWDDSNDTVTPHLFVMVGNHQSVGVFTDNLNFSRSHYSLYSVHSDMRSFRPGQEYDHEEMMIALRSMFQPTEDLSYLLELLACITNEAKVTSNDNGLNQQVTVNRGIANLQRERVKSIVRLKPYRTFPEVEQPESDFLVRLSTDSEGNIRVALHEADGGMWKLTARRTIAAYLRDALSQEIEDGRVTVMA